jgi:hypothetical protein
MAEIKGKNFLMGKGQQETNNIKYRKQDSTAIIDQVIHPVIARVRYKGSALNDV